MTLKQFLNNNTVGALAYEKKKLISVDDKTTCEEALKKLQEKNFLSLPITDKDGKILGVVDIFDLMTYISFSAFRPGQPHEALTAETLIERTHLDQPVSNIIGASEESKSLWIYNPFDRLDAVLEAFTKGVHRVLVRHKERCGLDYYVLVSQSDMAKFVHFYIESPELSDIAAKTLQELDLADPKEPVARIKMSEPVLKALRELNLKQYNGSCVVNEKDEVVSSLSASDLRGMSQDQLGQVLLSTEEFLKARNNGKLVHPVTVHPTSTYKEALSTLVAARVHRLFVVDSANKPLSVITLSDLLAVLPKNA